MPAVGRSRLEVLHVLLLQQACRWQPGALYTCAPHNTPQPDTQSSHTCYNCVLVLLSLERILDVRCSWFVSSAPSLLFAHLTRSTLGNMAVCPCGAVSFCSPAAFMCCCNTSRNGCSSGGLSTVFGMTIVGTPKHACSGKSHTRAWVHVALSACMQSATSCTATQTPIDLLAGTLLSSTHTVQLYAVPVSPGHACAITIINHHHVCPTP